MVRQKRVLGVSRALVPGAVACLVLGSGGCTLASDSQITAVDFGMGGSAGEPSGAAGGPLGRPGGSVGPSTGGSVGTVGAAGAGCGFETVAAPVFLDQMVEGNTPARLELYSWTTDAQASALRADRVLFSQNGDDGLGPGYALMYLRQLAASEAAGLELGKLASVLSGELFAKPRYAWPEPWATRMGWPGENYGGQLLRIVLKPEAWVVVVRSGTLAVTDAQNKPVSWADALANPTRLGAIFYQRDGSAGGPQCGSFQNGGNGYREFVLGNLAMVEEWSLGTQKVLDRLQANIEQLTRFFEQARACPAVGASASSWNASVSCSWDAPSGGPYSEQVAYEQALAIPSENYLAEPKRIAQIIETLQGDLFQLDPLVVVPGSH